MEKVELGNGIEVYSEGAGKCSECGKPSLNSYNLNLFNNGPSKFVYRCYEHTPSWVYIGPGVSPPLVGPSELVQAQVKIQQLQTRISELEGQVASLKALTN